MHKKLSQDEEKEFRKWARDNYSPYGLINGMWHPVIQEECSKINHERDTRINALLGAD